MFQTSPLSGRPVMAKAAPDTTSTMAASTQGRGITMTLSWKAAGDTA